MQIHVIEKIYLVPKYAHTKVVSWKRFLQQDSLGNKHSYFIKYDEWGSIFAIFVCRNYSQQKADPM